MPIEIDWKVFLVNENDEQLLDVNLIFDDINESDLLKMGGLMVPNSTRNQSGITFRFHFNF